MYRTGHLEATMYMYSVVFPELEASGDGKEIPRVEKRSARCRWFETSVARITVSFFQAQGVAASEVSLQPVRRRREWGGDNGRDGAQKGAGSSLEACVGQ